MNNSIVNLKRKREQHIVECEGSRKRKRVEPSITKGSARAKAVDSNKENVGSKTLNNRIVHPQRSADYSKEGEKRYKTRLFLGEANLSFTRAFLEKHERRHPGLSRSIIPTAYESFEYLSNTYGYGFLENKEKIKSKGVIIKYKVDATKLRNYQFLKDRHVQRIHFNFPHDGSPISSGTLPQMLREFFQEASEIQEPGDRVHLALPAPEDIEKRKFREGRIYCIYEATRNAGYNLIEKRLFGPERYPGYQHVQTRANNSASITERAREYIFEKLPFNASNNDFRAPTFHGAYNGGNFICLPEMETDSESSSYEDNESV